MVSPSFIASFCMKPASQRCHDAAHFIYDIRELKVSHLDGVALGASFRVAEYSDALYEVLAVPFPSNLGRAVNKRKAEFLGGRFLAALALERLGQSALHIGVGEHRQPLWPAHVGGSLSHSHDRLACLMTTNLRLGLGVDIEAILTDAGARKIASLVLGPAEEALLEAHPSGFALGFTAVFSGKEALFKALYPRVRHYFDFHAARLVSLDWMQGRLVLDLTRDLGSSYRAQDRFDLGVRQEDDRVLTYLVHEH
jgi:enterobactin synthetase component D